VKLYIAHAKGHLGIGDLAVVIAAGTPHRDEAFRACRLAIEAVKHEAPIWKQEHYVDGDSAWSEGCSLCEEHRDAELAAAIHGGNKHGHGD
jgi:molybdopterin synthase catalytic subunit